MFLGGGADTPAIAWLINKLCAVGPPTFVRKLEVAAKKPVGLHYRAPRDLGHLLQQKLSKIALPLINLQPWIDEQFASIEMMKKQTAVKLSKFRFPMVK